MMRITNVVLGDEVMGMWHVPCQARRQARTLCMGRARASEYTFRTSNRVANSLKSHKDVA